MRLEVTRKSDLAIRALRVLHDHGERLKGPDLAELVCSTSGFLTQVMNPLVKARWVRSDPGPTGGYSLVADIAALSLLDVIESIEGRTRDGVCVLADRPCDEQGHCALHSSWMTARKQLTESLDSISVSDAEIRLPGS
jgi:Rrf2 family protein